MKNFRALPRFQQILISVLTIHCLFVFGSLIHHFFTSWLKPPKAMVVRTVKIAPPPQKVIEKRPAKKSVVKHNIPKAQKPAQTKKRAVAAKKPKRESPLVSEIAKSFDTLKETPKRKSRKLNLPSKIEENKEPIKEESYSESDLGSYLIGYLQNSLQLPEYGRVKIQLTIDHLGRLSSCEVLEAISIKNAEFLRAELPQLVYPRLSDFGINKKSHTFIISFTNSEKNT